MPNFCKICGDELSQGENECSYGHSQLDTDQPAPRDGVTVGGFYGEYTPITVTSQSLTAGSSSPEWMPKETAPKDGRWFEAVCAGEFAPGEPYLPQPLRWQGDGWEKPDEGQTTIIEIHFDFWRDYDFAALRALTEGGECHE